MSDFSNRTTGPEKKGKGASLTLLMISFSTLVLGSFNYVVRASQILIPINIDI